jgi:hypothetical protein
MTAAFRTLTLSFVSLAALVFAVPARADHDHHGDLDRIDRLSQSIQSESRTLYYELRRVAFSNPDLRSAMNEVAQIYQYATRIHDGAHGHVSRRQMDRDVHAMKDLVHHVEEHLVHHSHYRRHIDRIDSRVHQLEDAIHDWNGDFGGGPVVADPWYGGGYTTRPGLSVGPGGVTIGGRGISIGFGR